MVTEQQTRSQFSAYAILAAPMMISGSILDMTAETLKTYTNKEVTSRLTAACDHINMTCLTACLSRKRCDLGFQR
eukprot:COSAG04_NODE_7712_length_1081_cov_1.200611_1_plen_75_part_00